MDKVLESDDLKLYTSKAMTNLIEYKWNNIAYQWYMIGLAFHLLFTIALALFV